MMRDITVKKGALLAKLEENRAKHREVFEAAVEGYFTEAMGLLEEHKTRLLSNKRTKVYIVLPLPEDHTADYDRVIGMVKMDTSETFVLSEQDYSQYIDDDWEWSRNWGTAATRYAAGATMSNYGNKFSKER